MSVRHVLITGGSRGIGLAIARLFAQNSYRCTLISRNEHALKTAISTLPPLDPKRSSIPHKYIVGDVSDPAFWMHSVVGQKLMLTSKSQSKAKSTPMSSKTEKEEEEAALLKSALEQMGREDMEKEGESWSGSSDAEEPTSNIVNAAEGTPETHPDDGIKERIDVLVNCAGVTENKLFVRTGRDKLQGIVNTNLTGLMMGTQYLLRYGYIQSKKDDENHSPVVINVASLLAVQGGFGAVVYSASKAGVLGWSPFPYS